MIARAVEGVAGEAAVAVAALKDEGKCDFPSNGHCNSKTKQPKATLFGLLFVLFSFTCDTYIYYTSDDGVILWRVCLNGGHSVPE